MSVVTRVLSLKDGNPVIKAVLLQPLKVLRARVNLQMVKTAHPVIPPEVKRLLQDTAPPARVQIVDTALAARERADMVRAVKAAEDMDLPAVPADMEGTDMIKHTLEGLSILQSPPQLQGRLRAPVVRLNDGLIMDDSVFECPTLVMGQVGSGKTYLMEEIMTPILKNAEDMNENVFIFCAKKDLLKFKRPQDIVISVDSAAPNSCWNIIKEVAVSRNPELTARDIAKSLTKDQRSDLQPFFENSCNDLLFNAIMAVYEDGLKKGITYANWHLFDFLDKVSLNRDAEISWYDVARTRPRFAHILDYLGDGLDQGYGIISEIRTLIHECFWGSFCSDKGQFSAIDALKSGGKRIFLYYDHANGSEASIKVFKTILNLLLKHSVDEENGRRTWFFLDEFSLLPETGIIDSMSLGRGAGFRLFACIQSAQLMTRRYKEDDAKALLSLFPNIICLKVQDAMSRSILSDRYGESLTLYSFNAPMQKVIQHAEHRKVVADYDFTMIQKKGDALMSIPNLSDAPFFYHGFRKELETI